MTDEELFYKEILKKQLLHNSNFIGFFYNIANELLMNNDINYWNTQTYYQTDHRLLTKVSFSSTHHTKLHLEIAPVNIVNFNDELSGVSITLYNETQNWEIHNKILELCKLFNLLSIVVQFETEQNARILYKVVIPIDESNRYVFFKILNIIKITENYAKEKGIEI